MIKSDQEFDKPYSYAPYVYAMRLALKSPYSAGTNSSFHLFVHSIGCAGSALRSINSQHIGSVCVTDLLANAAILHYVRGHRQELLPEFYNEGDQKLKIAVQTGADAEQEDISIDLQGGSDDAEELEKMAEPQTKSPGDWWEYIARRGGNVPAHILRTTYYAWYKSPALRAKSVGEFLKQYASSQLS